MGSKLRAQKILRAEKKYLRAEKIKPVIWEALPKKAEAILEQTAANHVICNAAFFPEPRKLTARKI